ncbi:MAG: YbjQ family protein, partial [Candidatus Marinimicrobia bacterium]|nr:YbjQ family protein [Candidatus Neomarinimicrobiota bacterium]
MIITTQDKLEDYDITKTIGLVQGSSIRARHIGNDILAGLRNIVGGEVHEYTKMLAES